MSKLDFFNEKFFLTKSNKFYSVILNIAFVSILSMYFQFLPFDIETQPTIVLIMIGIVLVYQIVNGFDFSDEDRLLLIHCSIICVFYLLSLIKGQGVVWSTTYLIKFLAGPLCFLFVFKYIRYLKSISLIVASSVIFVVAIILIFNIPFLKDVYVQIVSIMLRRYGSGEGIRGYCYLTPEPSYYVYFQILLLYSFEFLISQNKINRLLALIFEIGLVLIGFFTKSAFVILFSGLFLVQKFYLPCLLCKKGKVLFIIAILLPVLCLILIRLVNVIDLLPSNRLTDVISRLGDSINSISAIFFVDASMGYRLLTNTIFLASIFVYPFGSYLGGLETNWYSSAQFLGINVFKNSMFAQDYYVNSPLYAQAYIPNLVGSLGLFTIVFIVFLFYKNRNTNSKLKIDIFTTLFIFLVLGQSNFFNPVFWVLIAILKTDTENNNSYLIPIISEILND